MNAILVLLGLSLLAGPAREAFASRSRELPAEDHRLGAEEIRTTAARSAYDAILLLRPGWLGVRPRPDAVSVGPATVYVDSREIGSIEALASVPAASIRSIRFLDAAGRAPVAHVRSSILIRTR